MGATSCGLSGGGGEAAVEWLSGAEVGDLREET